MTCYYFKLIPETGPAVYLDDEPIKWDSVQIIGKRDPDWHGFNYEYTDGEVLLEFDCLAGKDFIEETYDQDGVDGLMLLQFGRLDGLTEMVLYEGKLNFATFERLKYGRVACSVEKSGIHDLIKSRWETKVAMNALKTIDGDSITPPSPIDIELHSKTLVNNFTKTTGVEGGWSPFVFEELGLKNIYFIFNTAGDEAENNNIAENQDLSLGITSTEPVAGAFYLFDLRDAGDFIFNISLKYEYNVKLIRRRVSLSTPKINDWSLTHYLHIIDKNGALRVKYAFPQVYSGDKNDQFLAPDSSEKVSLSLTNYAISLEAGDKIYVYAHFNCVGSATNWKGIETWIRTFSTSWDIEALTSTPATTAKCYLAHETINHVLNVVTNDDTSLVSDFFGRTDIGYAADGCGALNAITNGFQIRKFETTDRPPQISPKELIGSLNARYCLGIGYENNKVRFEGRDYFYQDEEILFISDLSEYSEKVATDLIYNNLEIGYTKYLDEGLRLLDEFNTKHEYISPIKRHDNKFSQLSQLIASGYAIETTRREIAANTQKDSTKYDDDCFIIAVIPDGANYVPERDEPFLDVTGVVSPSTSYNLRHSPKRMLLAWAKWLNGGFYYKNAGDLIRNTFFKLNGDLTTQFDTAETCNLGDPQKDLITEKNDISLSQFDERNRFFIPEWITFKTRISRENIELIRDCMTGQNLDGKNYGFIRHIRDDGNQCESWIYEMNYNPNTEQASFKLLKKRFIDVLDPTEFNCLDYSDHTFGMFEAISDLSISIEECRFENFN